MLGHRQETYFSSFLNVLTLICRTTPFRYSGTSRHHGSSPKDVSASLLKIMPSDQCYMKVTVWDIGGLNISRTCRNRVPIGLLSMPHHRWSGCRTILPFGHLSVINQNVTDDSPRTNVFPVDHVLREVRSETTTYEWTAPIVAPNFQLYPRQANSFLTNVDILDSNRSRQSDLTIACMAPKLTCIPYCAE